MLLFGMSDIFGVVHYSQKQNLVTIKPNTNYIVLKSRVHAHLVLHVITLFACEGY